MYKKKRIVRQVGYLQEVIILHLAREYISIYFLWLLQEENQWLFLFISVHCLVIVK